MKTLNQIIKLYKDQLLSGQCLLLIDEQKDKNVLFSDNGVHIAQMCRKDRCPIIYPTPKYKIVRIISRYQACRELEILNNDQRRTG